MSSFFSSNELNNIKSLISQNKSPALSVIIGRKELVDLSSENTFSLPLPQKSGDIGTSLAAVIDVLPASIEMVRFYMKAHGVNTGEAPHHFVISNDKKENVIIEPSELISAFNRLQEKKIKTVLILNASSGAKYTSVLNACDMALAPSKPITNLMAQSLRKVKDFLESPSIDEPIKRLKELQKSFEESATLNFRLFGNASPEIDDTFETWKLVVDVERQKQALKSMWPDVIIHFLENSGKPITIDECAKIQSEYEELLQQTQNSGSVLLEQEFKDSGEFIEFIENLSRFNKVYLETMYVLLDRPAHSRLEPECIINIINDSIKDMQNKQIYKVFKTPELLEEHVLNHDQGNNFICPSRMLNLWANRAT